MGTAVGVIRRRQLDPGKVAKIERANAVSRRNVASVGGTFGGYTPDLAQTVGRLTDAFQCVTVWSRNGELSTLEGFEKFFSATLPLGTATPPAGAGNEEPVTGFYRFILNDNSSRQGAITSNATPSIGHFYEVVGGVWTDRAYDTTPGPTGAITGDATTPEGTLFQETYFSPGQFLVFTNDFDVVYRFPRAGNNNEYTDFSSGTGLDPFRAKSVESFQGRVLFLNTQEAGTGLGNQHPRRFRGTNVSAAPTLTAAGSFATDLDEMNGEGLRALALGNLVALYFTEGIAFARPGPLVTQPFSTQTLDKRRGLLGTHAVVSTGPNVHFGIFTDGWFFLDVTGRWREAGLRQGGTQQFHKWKQDFYDRLNWDAKERIVCTFDEQENIVKVAAPFGTSTTPDEIWNYDVNNDVVWPDAYGSNQVNMWGRLEDTTGDTTWSAATDPWIITGGSWGSFTSPLGRLQVMHGTVGGDVFKHDYNAVLRDGTAPTYLWNSIKSTFGQSTLLLQGDKVSIRYKRLTGIGSAPTPAITTQLATEDALEGAAIATDKGTAGSHQTGYITSKLTGESLGVRLSGTAPTHILSYQVEYFTEGDTEPNEET